MIDHTLPEGKWAFDDYVTDVFDDMLRRSVPMHDVMRKAVFDIGKKFVVPHSDIVDLGCSRGEALAPFVYKFGALNRFVGVEVSEPMLEASRQRFSKLIEGGVVEIRNLDLRQEYPPARASLTMAILTMMFVPMEHRQRVFREVYKHTGVGGAFILVEKILGETAEVDAILTEAYYDLKRENSYSEDEIQRKKLSLEGVLVPVTSTWNVELLRGAGFRTIDCFWRWMNFAAWVAVRD
jgi:tRNA (cmo5U34)-methyltransferase